MNMLQRLGAKRSALLVMLFGFVVVGSWRLAGEAQTTSALAAEEPPPASQSAPPLPPLVVDEEAPLLLSDPATKADAEERAHLALNAACFVCHNNYEKESLVAVHAPEDVGCVDCHGDSFEHRNDENNITPPDVMFPMDEIDEACKECHDTHDVAATDVIARWQQRCPEKREVSQIVCTDCHGEHRLKNRTVRWNKETGELIPVEPAPADNGETTDVPPGAESSPNPD